MEITPTTAVILDKIRRLGAYKNGRTGQVDTHRQTYAIANIQGEQYVCAVPHRVDHDKGGKVMLLGIKSGQPLPVTTRTLPVYVHRIHGGHSITDELERLNQFNIKQDRDIRFIAWADFQNDTLCEVT